MVPETSSGWLTREEFRARLELAVDRHRRDGLRFAVHRLIFPEASEAVQSLTDLLPNQMRDTDSLCRPIPCEVLVLTAGPATGFGHARRRILALWDRSWKSAGAGGPAPPLRNEFIEMSAGSEAPRFVATVSRWLVLEDEAGA